MVGLVILTAFLSLTMSCGSEESKKSGQTMDLGPTALEFQRVAETHNIPKRLLLAIAMMESDITPTPSSAKYQDRSKALGLALGETAFGLTKAKLMLPDAPSSNELIPQLEAYARLIEARKDELGLSLSANPKTIEEKFDWIWLLARIHRGGLESRRNIQVVFALELMDFLNYGYTWQSLKTGEIVELGKENPPYDPSNFPAQIRNNLKLFTAASDIFTADYFELTYQRTSDKRNKPRNLRIIHCPFSLSACLEMQNPIEESDGIRLNAHYILPQNDEVVDKPLQVYQHSQVILLTNNQGIPESIQDSIVVMLAGPSGRYIEGKRKRAKPDWISKWQLKQMGSIIRNLCPMIQDENPDIKIEECINPESPKGVQFRHQGMSDEFQWGDIADFDPSIFWPHIARPDALEGNIKMELNSTTPQYKATEEIFLKVETTSEAAQIVIEQAQRCPDEKLVWTVMQNRRVKAVRSSTFKFTLYDPGPNGNGEHYIRAMVYNLKGDLLGWAVQNIVLTDYPKEVPGPGPMIKQCV